MKGVMAEGTSKKEGKRRGSNLERKQMEGTGGEDLLVSRLVFLLGTAGASITAEQASFS